MSAQETLYRSPIRDLNQLRKGDRYYAVTKLGTAAGEYLGMEASHGDRAIMLRTGSGIASIDVLDVTALGPVAA